MQSVLAARGQDRVDVEQVLHAADLGAEDDLIFAQSVPFRGLGRVERADDHRFHGDVARVERFGQAAVLIHHLGEQRLVERAPVHADAYRLLVLDGDLDHGAEVLVVLLADGAVAGVDAVLGERFGAIRIFLEQQVAVVMEVADDGRLEAEFVETLNDMRHRFSGFVIVDGHADQFGAGAGQRRNLLDGTGDVSGVGVGHRLHHDRCSRAHAHAADGDDRGLTTSDRGHVSPYFITVFAGLMDGQRGIVLAV